MLIEIGPPEPAAVNPQTRAGRRHAERAIRRCPVRTDLMREATLAEENELLLLSLCHCLRRHSYISSPTTTQTDRFIFIFVFSPSKSFTAFGIPRHARHVFSFRGRSCRVRNVRIRTLNPSSCGVHDTLYAKINSLLIHSRNSSPVTPPGVNSRTYAAASV